jgi:hypothetical protein
MLYRYAEGFIRQQQSADDFLQHRVGTKEDAMAELINR